MTGKYRGDVGREAAGEELLLVSTVDQRPLTRSFSSGAGALGSGIPTGPSTMVGALPTLSRCSLHMVPIVQTEKRRL